MNAEAHCSAVILINEKLGHPFPYEELTEGAQAPDYPKGAKIKFNETFERKHHFDNIANNGTLHAEDEITEVVLKYLHKSRKSWIADQRGDAAYYFGIASHYYLDAFIISTTVDPERHRIGDYSLGAAVTKLNRNRSLSLDPTIQTQEPSDAYVKNLLLHYRAEFGKNNSNIMQSVLLDLGYLALAVIDPRFVPTSLTRTLASYLSKYKQQLDNISKQHKITYRTVCDNLAQFKEERLLWLQDPVNSIGIALKWVAQSCTYEEKALLSLPEKEKVFTFSKVPSLREDLEFQTDTDNIIRARETVLSDMGYIYVNEVWFSRKRADQIAELHKDTASHITQTHLLEISTHSDTLSKDYITTVGKQNADAIKNIFLNHFSMLWSSNQSEERASRLAKNPFNVYYNFIIAIPISIVSIILSYLISPLATAIVSIVSLVILIWQTCLVTHKKSEAVRWKVLQRAKENCVTLTSVPDTTPQKREKPSYHNTPVQEQTFNYTPSKQIVLPDLDQICGVCMIIILLFALYKIGVFKLILGIFKLIWMIVQILLFLIFILFEIVKFLFCGF